MIREVERDAASGYLPLFLLLVATAGDIWWMVVSIQIEDPLRIIASIEYRHHVRMPEQRSQSGFFEQLLHNTRLEPQMRVQ